MRTSARLVRLVAVLTGATAVAAAAYLPAAAGSAAPGGVPTPAAVSRGRAAARTASALAATGGGTVAVVPDAAPSSAPPAPPTPARELPGVVYGTDGGPLEMDVYLPAGSGPTHQAPVVILLHGGGWVGGGRADVASEAQALQAAGLAVLNVDYRLAAPGQPGYPHQLSDIGLALDWARGNGPVLGLDPSRIGALGVSAGGNLALELGVRGLVSAVASWSGPTDLAALERPGSRCTTPSCGPLSLSYAAYQYLGCLPEACPRSYAGASPAEQRSAPGVRYLVWNSTDELVPLAQAQEFVSAQRAAGVPVAEHVVAGHLHAAQYAATALAPTVAFLVSSLSAPTAA